MTFKAQLRQIGNSRGVIIPQKVITDYKLGDVIMLDVITAAEEKQKDLFPVKKVEVTRLISPLTTSLK